MFAGAPDADAIVDPVLHGPIDHPVTKAHTRHLPIETAREIGLRDAASSVHNAALLTLTNTAAYRLIENQDGFRSSRPMPRASEGHRFISLCSLPGAGEVDGRESEDKPQDGRRGARNAPAQLRGRRDLEPRAQEGGPEGGDRHLLQDGG